MLRAAHGDPAGAPATTVVSHKIFAAAAATAAAVELRRHGGADDCARARARCTRTATRATHGAAQAQHTAGICCHPHTHTHHTTTAACCGAQRQPVARAPQ